MIFLSDTGIARKKVYDGADSLNEETVYKAFNADGDEAETFNDSYLELFERVGRDAMLKLFKYFRGDKIDCPMKLYRPEFIADLVKQETDRRERAKIARAGGYTLEILLSYRYIKLLQIKAKIRKEAMIMFCHICGTQIEEGSIFCHKCGTKVVYEQVADTERNGKTNTRLSLEKPAKIIYLISVAAVILVLVKSGILENALDTLSDINREIESQIEGGNIVQDMQSAADVFSLGISGETTGTSSESSFAWVEDAHMVTDGDDLFKTRYIIGEIKNISDITFVSASVEFILYDSAGNQIDTTSDHIKSFKAGNTWKFKAIVLSDDVAYFEFLHATKTYPRY